MAGISRKRSPEWDNLSDDDLVDKVTKICKEQSEQAKAIMRTHLDKPNWEKHVEWFRERRVWRDVAAACGTNKVAELAAELGLDQSDPYTLFMNGLSVMGESNRVWDMVIDSTTGHTHDRLLEIRQFENEANAQIYELVSNAAIQMRGSSTDDALDMYEGRERRAGKYSFVSMSPVLQEAEKFASLHEYGHDGNRVVMIMDGSVIREAEPGYAKYSIASEALRLKPERESVRQMSRFRFAPEMQVHFDRAWPPRVSGALLAIWKIGDISPPADDEIEYMGVPVVSWDGI